MVSVPRRTVSLLCLFTSSLFATLPAAPAATAPAQPRRHQSWEVTMTLVRAMELLPQAQPPAPAPMAAGAVQNSKTLKPIREANDADTIQTVLRRRAQAGHGEPVTLAALSATTSSAVTGISDADDRLFIPDSYQDVEVPAITGDQAMTEVIYRQVVMKLAIVLYRQQMGRYPEGLDALTAGRRNYFADAAELVPATSRYAQLAREAADHHGMPAPMGLRWSYSAAADGNAYLLGACAAGAGKISVKQPLVSNLLGTGELPILPGTTARLVISQYKAYCSEHSKPL